MADTHATTITVIIKNPEKLLYEGTAKSVSSIDEKGVFDILPQHSNFISIIKDHVMVHKVDGTIQEFKCREGVLRVEDNIIKAYVDILPVKQ